jgi:hypothetical protein
VIVGRLPGCTMDMSIRLWWGGALVPRGVRDAAHTDPVGELRMSGSGDAVFPRCA